MIRSTLLALVLAICIVGFNAQTLNDDCINPTVLNWEQGGQTATLELISNGDAELYPSENELRASFVNQRQGSVKFFTQVGFGDVDSTVEYACPGYLFYDEALDSLFVVTEVYGPYGQPTTYATIDVVEDSANEFVKKRSAPSPLYVLSEVPVVSEKNTFSFSVNGRGNYFFAGSSVVACLDVQCQLKKIIEVEGQINAAYQSMLSLLVLSVKGNTLIISNIENNEITSSQAIKLAGDIQSHWSFLSESSFIGVVSEDLSIADIDGTVTKVDTVGSAVVKVVNQLLFSYVSVQTEDSLINYVCKGVMCRKVAKSSFTSKFWDMDVSREKDTIFAFASFDEITVVTCDRFDCQSPHMSVIKAPGVVSNIEVSTQKKEPTIVYSLENGATGILNCFDEICSGASLTRASDYLSSPFFSFLTNAESTILFANNKVQTFNTHRASPQGELCRPTIDGNHAVDSGEVFVCNALPVTDNYIPIYFWTPVVTSVFAQNL